MTQRLSEYIIDKKGTKLLVYGILLVIINHLLGYQSKLYSLNITQTIHIFGFFIAFLGAVGKNIYGYHLYASKHVLIKYVLILYTTIFSLATVILFFIFLQKLIFL